MAASRIVSRNARIMATNAAEIAATSRRRKAWRKRVSVMARSESASEDVAAPVQRVVRQTAAGAPGPAVDSEGGDDPPPSHGLSIRETGCSANLARAAYNCVRSERAPAVQLWTPQTIGRRRDLVSH